jgi:molybdopterin converting factor subunit 1
MKISIKLFALYREAVGQRELTWTVAEGTTVADLWQALRDAYPDLPNVAPTAAINAEYVSPTAVLRDGDEVAFLPPVSGG